MIITRIIGGLGNQLFQYAAGRCLAHLRKTQLKLDVTGFKDYSLRSFDLSSMNPDLFIAHPREIKALLPSNHLGKAIQYLSPTSKRKWYRERKFSFEKDFFKLGENVYLKGYFQSEKYFNPARDIIRKEFSFKPELINELNTFSNRIKSANSVSLHVRRGDISIDPDSLAYHGVLPKEYYLEAIRKIRERIPGAEFFLFTDDIEWAKENFKIDGLTFVSREFTRNHIQDLYLMTQCHHNIIANSSFSWWGAWLNNNPDKIVIAPKKWFNKGPRDTQDLIPEGWTKI